MWLSVAVKLRNADVEEYGLTAWVFADMPWCKVMIEAIRVQPKVTPYCFSDFADFIENVRSSYEALAPVCKKDIVTVPFSGWIDFLNRRAQMEYFAQEEEHSVRHYVQ